VKKPELYHLSLSQEAMESVRRCFVWSNIKTAIALEPMDGFENFV
jgi:hypothetical protein